MGAEKAIRALGGQFNLKNFNFVTCATLPLHWGAWVVFGRLWVLNLDDDVQKVTDGSLCVAFGAPLVVFTVRPG